MLLSLCINHSTVSLSLRKPAYKKLEAIKKKMYHNMVHPIVTYLPHAPPSYLPHDVAVTAVTDLPHTPAPPSSHLPPPAP